ncbi:hypothetical protein Pan44_39980 [Caulifigura coniformis]|uniref:pEK499-p136 HEPN domain-containing protein n=1 Tax=Caulifigura coniformis TaxID=2527983 RepID=A0A517SIK1_9PLAN|nr:HEPN family nuclease [Caulifigura coniformis]QDT55950.1 hypothetical protein Pan44_39980 [Caulifigura coniformis]
MYYEDLVKDFAKRTQRNLAVIRERRAAGDEVYDVTQLINSMLGLLVLPKEHYYDRIPQTPLDELRDAGWPAPVVTGEMPEPKDLRKLMALLRNSIAHCNMTFTERGGRITGVEVWNTKNGKKDGERNWTALLSLQDLESITDRFTEVILSLPSKD